MIVGREQHQASDPLRKVLQYGRGDASAVERRGAPPKLIKHRQRTLRAVGEEGRRFFQLARSVLFPSRMESYEPIRVKMRSIGFSRHDVALTRMPSCAMTTAMQVCRNTVDFPPMFGPVTTRTPGTPSQLRRVSFGTKAVPIFDAATGWRPPRISSIVGVSPCSTTSGLHESPGSPWEACASAKSTSSSDMRRTATRNWA